MNHSHCRGLENADCPGWGPHSRQCSKMSGGVEEHSWEAQRRDALKPWMYLVRVRRDKE